MADLTPKIEELQKQFRITFPELHVRALLNTNDPIHEACDFLLSDSPHRSFDIAKMNSSLRENEYDPWPDFLVAFASNGCGDYFAYDLRSEPPTVIYIDPDDTVIDNLASDDQLTYSKFDSWYAEQIEEWEEQEKEQEQKSIAKLAQDQTLVRLVENALSEGRRSIEISGAGELDLTPLTRIPDLESLVMSCSEVSDYRPLSRLTNLRNLSLCSDEHFDISPLASLALLEELDLTDGSITDLRPLAKLTRLRRLSLKWCGELMDISPLQNLSQLESLTLYECDVVTDLRPLAKCSALTYVNLTDCFEITDVSPLASLSDLRTLVLANTKVTDTTLLSKISDLEIKYEEDD